MSIFKKNETKRQIRSALRPLSLAETRAVGGGKQPVCRPTEHYYAGQCVKNK